MTEEIWGLYQFILYMGALSDISYEQFLIWDIIKMGQTTTHDRGDMGGLTDIFL